VRGLKEGPTIAMRWSCMRGMIRGVFSIIYRLDIYNTLTVVDCGGAIPFV